MIGGTFTWANQSTATLRVMSPEQTRAEVFRGDCCVHGCDSVLLRLAINVSEEHITSIFRVDMCKKKDWLSYRGSLQ
jgi:hypothetical protein